MNETSPRPVRILILDDRGAFGEARAALECEGYVVEYTPGGIAALDAGALFSPDITLLPRIMPDLPGAQVVVDLADYLARPLGIDELVFELAPVVRRLGLAEHSRRVADLVLDESTTEVWRDEERLRMSPLEFEMLRVLVDEPGRALSLGAIVRRVSARGIRLPRELAEKLLGSLRSTINAGRRPLLQLAASGDWTLAATL